MFGKRYQLKKSLNPPSDPPKRIRTSMLASWFWCAEQARLQIEGKLPEEEGPKDAADIGTMLHKVLEESMGRRFPWEEDFLIELDKAKSDEFGFMRKMQGSLLYAELTGHPDDFQITRDYLVSVVEHKTVGRVNEWFIERYKLPMARFQSQIYSFILAPYVEKLGGTMHRFNSVVFWEQPKVGGHLVPFKSYPIEYYPEKTKEDISTALKACQNPEAMGRYKPQEWKCDQCYPRYKERCQYMKEEKRARKSPR